MEKLRQSFETNFFGVVAVTQAFVPLLQRSTVGGGRIVNVSSQLASFNNNLADRNKLAYSTSKTALNMMTYQFAKEFANNKSSIKINSVDPGRRKESISNVRCAHTRFRGLSSRLNSNRHDWSFCEVRSCECCGRADCVLRHSA